MREHQIVITLKPEQFLEVQRLARAANAKSMGMFVRQKLLAALGIEGNLAPATTGGSAASPQAVNEVLAELQRLHGELRGFVTESVSQYGVEPYADSLIYDDEPVDEAEQPESPAGVNDEFEDLAARTFAISPRLGALEPPPAVLRDPLLDQLDVNLPVKDPLASLLSDEALPKLSKTERDRQRLMDIDEDEEEYVPLSLRQKRSEKAEEQKSTGGDNFPDEVPVKKSTEVDKDDSDDSEDESSKEDEPLDLPKPVFHPTPSTQQGNSGGSANFSGGPPPKRRRE